MKQLRLVEKHTKAYGGTLLRTRNGRSGPRPLATRSSMHLILRSSRAQFKTPENARKVQEISEHFCRKHMVRIYSMANVGNHLHFHIQLRNRHTYRAFIRGLTAALAMAIGGASRWNPSKEKFWDYRPFTRIVEGYRAFLNLRDYIQINQLEGFGIPRAEARTYLNWRMAVP